jgi:hypothetical protein
VPLAFLSHDTAILVAYLAVVASAPKSVRSLAFSSGNLYGVNAPLSSTC